MGGGSLCDESECGLGRWFASVQEADSEVEYIRLITPPELQ